MNSDELKNLTELGSKSMSILDKMVDSIAKIQDRYDSIAKNQARYDLTSKFEKMNQARVDATEKFEKMHQARLDAITKFEKINQARFDLTSKFEKINQARLDAITKFEKINQARLDSIAKFQKINMNGLNRLDAVLADLPISLGEVVFQGTDMQALEVEPFFENVDFSQPEKLWDWAIQTISDAKAKFAANKISKTTLTLVVSLVIWVVQNLCFTVSYNYLFSEAPEVNSYYETNTYYETNITINLHFPELVESGSKIVRRNVYMRRKSRGRSEVVGYLLEGDLVHVLEKRNHWRLIRWPDGELYAEGWVKAKYLRSPKPLSKYLRKNNSFEE